MIGIHFSFSSALLRSLLGGYRLLGYNAKRQNPNRPPLPPVSDAEISIISSIIGLATAYISINIYIYKYDYILYYILRINNSNNNNDDVNNNSNNNNNNNNYNYNNYTNYTIKGGQQQQSRSRSRSKSRSTSTSQKIIKAIRFRFKSLFVEEKEDDDQESSDDDDELTRLSPPPILSLPPPKNLLRRKASTKHRPKPLNHSSSSPPSLKPRLKPRPSTTTTTSTSSGPHAGLGHRLVADAVMENDAMTRGRGASHAAVANFINSQKYSHDPTATTTTTLLSTRSMPSMPSMPSTPLPKSTKPPQPQPQPQPHTTTPPRPPAAALPPAPQPSEPVRHLELLVHNVAHTDMVLTLGGVEPLLPSDGAAGDGGAEGGKKRKTVLGTLRQEVRREDAKLMDMTRFARRFAKTTPLSALAGDGPRLPAPPQQQGRQW